MFNAVSCFTLTVRRSTAVYQNRGAAMRRIAVASDIAPFQKFINLLIHNQSEDNSGGTITFTVKGHDVVVWMCAMSSVNKIVCLALAYVP